MENIQEIIQDVLLQIRKEREYVQQVIDAFEGKWTLPPLEEMEAYGQLAYDVLTSGKDMPGRIRPDRILMCKSGLYNLSILKYREEANKELTLKYHLFLFEDRKLKHHFPVSLTNHEATLTWALVKDDKRK